MKLEFEFTFNAPIAKVWDAIADWRSQGDWMLATRVEVVDDRGGLGTRIAAFTGIFPSKGWLGIWDQMEVTSWQPRYRCEVLHYGRWLRGHGYFHLAEISPQQTRFIWGEELIGFLAALLKPGLAVGVWLSLRRFSRLVASN